MHNVTMMEIRLPRLGEGADSGAVIAILVKEGDRIRKDQPIIELENEKAVASIPSTSGGTVTKIHVKQGDKIAVGQLILTLADGGLESRPAPAPAPAMPQPMAGAPIAQEPGEGAGLPAASPTVRKAARELGIDLRRIKGSERGGRITMEDLRGYVAWLQQQAGKPSIDFSKWGPVTKRPVAAIRQTIARRMSESWMRVPHVTQFDEADLTQLLAVKKKADAAFEKKGAKLTVTSILLKVIVAVLKRHPTFNASLDEAAQELVLKQYYHLGIAIDTEAGLMVPVIRDVDKKSCLALSKELSELVEKTRARKVSAEELQGGTFTISNQGGIGGGPFTPIIKLPEVAILGLGKATQQAVIREGAVVARTMLPLSLSYDHRVIDGADAARFITDLVASIATVTEALVKA